MRNAARNEMRRRGWCVVKTTMTVHDVPFNRNPLEVVPTEEDLEMLRNNFDRWMANQGTLPIV